MAVADVYLLGCINIVLAKCYVGYLWLDMDSSSILLLLQLLIRRSSHWLDTALA